MYIEFYHFSPPVVLLRSCSPPRQALIGLVGELCVHVHVTDA